MKRLSTILYRLVACGMLTVLLFTPSAFAQITEPNNDTSRSGLVPLEESPRLDYLESEPIENEPAAEETIVEEPIADETIVEEPSIEQEIETATAIEPADITPQAAGDERWDDRFGMPGLPDKVTALTRAANGTLYAATGTYNAKVWRWDGRAWKELTGTFNGTVHDIAVNGNNVYVVGEFSKVGTIAANQIAVWNGTTWARVGTGAGPQLVGYYGDVQTGTVYAVAFLGSNLYVGGKFNRIGGVNANGIARLNGNTWSALGNGVRIEHDFDPQYESGIVRAFAVANNKLYVGGVFEVAGNLYTNSMAVWDGGNWSGLGGGVIDDDRSLDPAGMVLAIAISGNNVYIGGNFDHAGNVDAKNIARWNGTSWSALGDGIMVEFESDFSEVVQSIVVVGNNVYIAGKFDTAGDQVAHLFARWNGTSWSALNNDKNFQQSDEANVLAAGPNNGVYVGGTFRIAGTYLSRNIGLWTGTAWQALGQGATEGIYIDNAAQIRAMAFDNNGRIYVGGRMATVGGMPVNNIAMWDGTKWNALGSGTEGNGGLDDGSVEAMVLVGNDLYVGGNFTKAGGVTAQHLAKYNIVTRQWSSVGGGLDGPVNSLTFSNGELYVGGNFELAGSVEALDVAVWNGTRWRKLGNSLQIFQVFDSCNEQSTMVYDVKVQGNLVYIGGNFRAVYRGTGNICQASSYILANHLLIFDQNTNQWFTLGKGTPGVSGGTKVYARPVSALQAKGEYLYVGGHFTKAGDVAASNLARFKLDGTWSALGGGVSGTGYDGALSTGPEVRSLWLEGNDLYVGGDFTATGGTAARNLALYNIGTNSWSTIGSGVHDPNGSTTVMSLLRAPAGLYVGGKFQTAGLHSSVGIGFWNMGPLPIQNKRIFLAGIF